MRDRQWIRVQVPDIKSLQIPINITKAALPNHLVGVGKGLLEGLSDDDERKKIHDQQRENAKHQQWISSIYFQLILNPLKTIHWIPIHQH